MKVNLSDALAWIAWAGESVNSLANAFQEIADALPETDESEEEGE